jgi:hypothetical protein
VLVRGGTVVSLDLGTEWKNYLGKESGNMAGFLRQGGDSLELLELQLEKKLKCIADKLECIEELNRRDPTVNVGATQTKGADNKQLLA